jgi:hypothetical protein
VNSADVIMAVNTERHQSDGDRSVPYAQYEDHFEDDDDELEPEFSTYFSDQKVDIPTFPDDDKVIFEELSGKSCHFYCLAHSHTFVVSSPFNVVRS